MRKIFLGVVAFLLVDCRRAGFVPCDDTSCPRGERCVGGDYGLCVIDRPPELTLSPITGVQTQSPVEVTGTATDDVSISLVESSIDDGGTWVRASVAGEMVRASVAVPELDSAPLSVLIRVTDTGEQRVSKRVDFSVDRVGPQSMLVEPTRRVGGASVRVVAQAVDGCGQVASMRLVFDGQTLALASLDGGQFAGDLPLPQGREERLGLSLQATDVYGNESATPVGIDIATRGPSFELVGDAGFVGPLPRPVLFRSVLPTQKVTATWRGLSVGVDVSVPNVYSVILSVDAGVTEASGPLAVSGLDSTGNPGSTTLTVPIDAVGPVVRFLAQRQLLFPGSDN